MKKLYVKTSLYAIGWAVLILLAIQMIPYGKIYTNPPVVKEPLWNSPTTRTLAKRACFDCHSHETVWPGYARIAPVSWLLRFDVDEGRKELNFSDWKGNRESEQATKISKVINKGEMPPLQYTQLHREARLSATEKDMLIKGLTATVGSYSALP